MKDIEKIDLLIHLAESFGIQELKVPNEMIPGGPTGLILKFKNLKFYELEGFTFIQLKKLPLVYGLNKKINDGIIEKQS